MPRKFLRPGWIVGHLLVVLAVLICLRLGLWQWHRTHEANGTIQNLGYTILWPVFGVAFVYMWIRFLQLELTKDAEDDHELTEMAAGVARYLENSDESATAVTYPSAVRADSFEPGTTPTTDLTRADVPSDSATRSAEETRSNEVAADVTGEPAPSSIVTGPTSRRPPSRGYTVAVSTVGDDNEDEDPELAAYNRALAALAAKDHRRAR